MYNAVTVFAALFLVSLILGITSFKKKDWKEGLVLLILAIISLALLIYFLVPLVNNY
jgi:antibiotic biosynthesis monooxygenase (ABM) superfamily enzyme